MGYCTCKGNTLRPHRETRVCWRCDECPTCTPAMGRLTKGDYCRKCVAELKALGYVWSDYCQNYVAPQEGALIAAQPDLVF